MPISYRPRILITRSRHQTSDLAAHLQALGADPILIPAIAIAPPGTYAPLDAALANLHTFNWLVFTSANAVDAFHQRLGPKPPATLKSAKSAKTAKTAAIGPATARALTEIGLPPDLVPPQAIAESLAHALLPHIAPGQTRVLLIRAEIARDILPEALRSAGADLTVAPAYRNLIPEDSIPLLQALFRTPATWPDAITFTSSSTATNLLALLEASGLTLPPDGAIAGEGKTILRASIGPITSSILRDLGYPPHLESPEATIPSLVETLARALDL